MEMKINRSPKSVTLHIDKKKDALKLAADLQRAAEHEDAFPGTTLVMIVPGKRVRGKQEFANTSIRCGVKVALSILFLLLLASSASAQKILTVVRIGTINVEEFGTVRVAEVTFERRSDDLSGKPKAGRCFISLDAIDHNLVDKKGRLKDASIIGYNRLIPSNENITIGSVLTWHHLKNIRYTAVTEGTLNGTDSEGKPLAENHVWFAPEVSR